MIFGTYLMQVWGNSGKNSQMSQNKLSEVSRETPGGSGGNSRRVWGKLPEGMGETPGGSGEIPGGPGTFLEQSVLGAKPKNFWFKAKLLEAN
jgi:hypothetical protein